MIRFEMNDQLWQAVVARDARFDGQFVFAVSSTKVYCRPSCPSRRPQRERVSFFNLPEAAEEAGLITFAPDDLDWEDEIRLAIEERTSLSPDALTGMEASLRFAGPETMDTKIYGRLTAWQNWIFQRPNAVGEHGALTNYGKPTKAQFDYKRT